MCQNILIVEDDTYLRTFIGKSLSHAGYNCVEAACGKEGITALKKTCFDLVIMDLDLGDTNGEDIIKSMRKQSLEIPVIVVSTFNNLDTKVDLFDSGCDDYITKPFYVDELLARVRRILSRNSRYISDGSETLKDEILDFNGIQLNYSDSTIIRNGERLEVSKKVFEILVYFINNPNRIVSKDLLLDRFWSDSEIIPDNTLTVHIHKLRSLIEENPSQPVHLKTKRGLGYIFNLQS